VIHIFNVFTVPGNEGTQVTKLFNDWKICVFPEVNVREINTIKGYRIDLTFGWFANEQNFGFRWFVWLCSIAHMDFHSKLSEM